MTQSTNATDQLYVVTCERKSNDSRFQASKPITRKRAEAFLADHRYSGGDDNPKSPFKNYRIEEYHGEGDDGPILKPVETWKFKISRGDDVYAEFERHFAHDENLGTPFDQADLLARGLQNKFPKQHVNATCTTSNSFIAMQSFEDLIKSEMFYHDNRQRPIDLSGVYELNVKATITRALISRHGETDEVINKAREITTNIIEKSPNRSPQEGEFEIEVDGFNYRFEFERFDEDVSQDWFDIQAEAWPPKCPDCESKLKHDGINDQMCKEWFICEVCDERFVRSRGVGNELDQAV